MRKASLSSRVYIARPPLFKELTFIENNEDKFITVDRVKGLPVQGKGKKRGGCRAIFLFKLFIVNTRKLPVGCEVEKQVYAI